ncbi:hypothetical protein FJ656_26205 [Schumannella luteola]|nr:hypothetical protein FJ656_26205 [Schumannella luteola]
MLTRDAHGGGELVIAAVEELRHTRDELGDDPWRLMTMEFEGGGGMIAAVRDGVRWIDRPELDLAVEITLCFPLGAEGEDIPQDVVDWLNGIDDALQAVLGDDGLVVMHSTLPPWRTVFSDLRDGDADALRRLRDYAKTLPKGKVTTARDPGWYRVGRAIG